MVQAGQLTILIPTYNRFPFLKRLLSYYARQHVAFQFIVADSSDPDQSGEARALVDSLSGKLALQYETYPPDIGYWEKFLDGLRKIKTPFAVFCADDDFLVPGALEEAIDFLDAHRDYATVSGRALSFLVASNDAYGAITLDSEYPQRDIEDVRGADRLVNHFTDYTTTFYSVYRTEQLYRNFEKVIRLDLGWEFAELALSGIAIAQGKAKKLDQIYMLRQGGGTTKYYAREPWLQEPSWAGQYTRFRDAIAETLCQSESMDFTGAQTTVRDAFKLYLRRYFNIFPMLKAYEEVVKPHHFLLRGLIFWFRTHWRELWQRRHQLGKLDAAPRRLISDPQNPYYRDSSLIWCFLLEQTSDSYIDFNLLLGAMFDPASPLCFKFMFWLTTFLKSEFPFHNEIRSNISPSRTADVPVAAEVLQDAAYQAVGEAVQVAEIG